MSPASRRPRAPRSGARRPRAPARASSRLDLSVLDARDLDALRRELEREFPVRRPARWNANPEDAQRALAKLVLTLVEFLRRLMEGQAIRRMEQRTLTPEQVEAVGAALMRLEETIGRIGAHFDLALDDLQLDLGPLGRLV